MHLHLVYSLKGWVDFSFQERLSKGKLLDSCLLVDSTEEQALGEKGVEISLLRGKKAAKGKHPSEELFGAVHNCRLFHMVYDQASHRLSLTSDRFASIEFFYYLDSNVFLLSTSFQKLLSLLGRGLKKLDWSAASELVDYGYCLYGKTLVSEAKRFPYATRMVISPAGCEQQRYWDFGFSEDLEDSLSSGVSMKELGNHLTNAISQCLPKSSEVIIPLSGGMDSRLILAVALDCIPASKITAFTVGQSGTQDMEFARRITKSFGLRHIVEMIENERATSVSQTDWSAEYLAGIELNSACIDATPYGVDLRAYRQLSEFGEILLSGYMGDPLFGSHLAPHMLCPIPHGLDPLPSTLARQRDNPLPGCLNRHSELGPPAEIMGALSRYKTVAGFSMHWDFAVRQQDYIKHGQLFRLSGLFDVRSPFLEPNLFQYACMRIPLCQKISERFYAKTNLNRFPHFFDGFPTTAAHGVKLSDPHWKGRLYRIMNKINKLCRYPFFPSYPKLNFRDYRNVAQAQPGYRKFLTANCNELYERSVISPSVLENFREDISGPCSKVITMGRLATLNLFIRKNEITVSGL